MFARGSNGDADHRGTDLEADIFSNATSNFRSDEAALPLTDASSEWFSNCTTDRATQSGTDRVAVLGAVASTVSSTDIVTNCRSDRGADASTVSSTDIVTDCPADSCAYSSTFSAADGAADYLANGLAYEGAHGGASVSADTGTDCGADSITFGTTNGAANDVSDGEANRGADSGASTATNTGTDRAAVATTLSAANCAADSVSNCEAVATALSAADDSISNGEAFFDADNGADVAAVAPANYFTANHITTTYSDSDHEYAYDVNSDVCSHRLAVISTRAEPYGAALQHADNRSAVATAVAEPDCIADISAVAAAEPCSLGNSDCEPDGRADSPPIDLARTDHVRSVAVADSLTNSVDRAHAAGAARSARQHYLGPRHVGRQLDRRGLRRRGEHLFVVRRRHARGGRGFDRSPAAEALVVHR